MFLFLKFPQTRAIWAFKCDSVQANTPYCEVQPFLVIGVTSIDHLVTEALIPWS